MSVSPDDVVTPNRHLDNALPTTLKTTYKDKAYRWNRENYSRHRRFVDIWGFVFTLMTGTWLNGKSWSYQGGVTEAKQAKRRKQQAIWIRETLLDLRTNIYQSWSVIFYPRRSISFRICRGTY